MNDKELFPKTLVLCQNKINQFTGGGIVLSNLFGKVSPDRLMFFHRDVDYDDDSLFVEKRLNWRWLRFNLFNSIELFARWVVACLVFFKKPSLKDFKGILIQSCYFYFPRDVDQQVKEFSPDVLYAWCSDILWAETIKSVAVRYDIPYVIHFMDNHVDLDPKSTLEMATFPIFKRELAKLVNKSVVLFTISESMGGSYQKRWGKPYEVYHGLIESNKWPLSNTRHLDNNSFKVAYTGSIEDGQLLGLKDIATALDKFISKGVDVKLILYLTPVYTQSVKSSLGSFRCVEIKLHPDFSSLRNELLKADLLVLAFGFDEQTINYYRYSFATKIVPYMLSGRPILVYGPDEIEPVKYAIKGGWASIVREHDVELLFNTIKKLISDKNERESLAKRAWMAGIAEHDLHSNANRFKSSLSNISKIL